MILSAKSKFDEYVKMGLVRSQTEGDLTIYQYTEFTQFESLWNNCTLNARGIVFDNDGALVQRCIPKFFNHDEPDGIKVEKLMLKEQIGIVQEKLDGSLIKITKDPKHGLVITSKASFESDQAKMAKEIVNENSYDFKEGWTYHFELIHPDNQMTDRSPYDWSRIGEDEVDKTILRLINTLFLNNLEIIVISGRDEVCRQETIKWLRDNSVPFNRLFMRANLDSRKDNVIKREIFEREIKLNYRVEFVLDDRSQVVEMWRSLGLKCLQVEDGDF